MHDDTSGLSPEAAQAFYKVRRDQLIGNYVEKTGMSRAEVLALPREDVEIAVTIWNLDSKRAQMNSKQST